MTSTALAVHTRRLDVPTTTSGHHVPVAGAPQQRGARGPDQFSCQRLVQALSALHDANVDAFLSMGDYVEFN
jgi:hypothetical protein